MKALILTILVAVATALPVRDNNEPLEVIVNGVPEGHALEIGQIVGIELQQEKDGQIVSENVLHPFSTAGIIEAAIAAAAAESSQPEADIAPVAPETPEVAPEVVLPEPGLPSPQPIEPEVPQPEEPQPIVLPPEQQPEAEVPEVVLPEVPQPVVLPEVPTPEVSEPIVEPETVVAPVPEEPENVVAPEPEADGVASSQVIYNDGIVSVSANLPQESSVYSTVQSWFQFVVNYIVNSTPVASHQIV